MLSFDRWGIKSSRITSSGKSVRHDAIAEAVVELPLLLSHSNYFSVNLFVCFLLLVMIVFSPFSSVLGRILLGWILGCHHRGIGDGRFKRFRLNRRRDGVAAAAGILTYNSTIARYLLIRFLLRLNRRDSG